MWQCTQLSWNQRTWGPNRRCIKSGRKKPKPMQRRPLTCSMKAMKQNIPRLLSACRKTVKGCWLSMTSRLCTGRVSGPATRLNPPLPPFVTAPNVPKAASHVMECCTWCLRLGQCAEKRWRRLRGFSYLTKVIEGTALIDGIEVISVQQIAAWFNVPIHHVWQ